jgi:Na+-transporting NADH:ubiquinone oxidoreductase subunit NqrB
MPRDARVFQILFLGLLLGAGVWLRDFSLRPEQVAMTFAAGLLTQGLCARARGLKRAGYPSAAITCFSLSILLRADNLWAHPLAAVAAIAAKFLVRCRGKHLFNPGNLGIILALLLLPGTWTSPGQWGHDLAFAAWFVALGSVVTSRARRGDVSWAFLVFYLGAVALRIVWLGQSRAVFLHQLGNGSLLLFAFFMISDPMTIPNHSRGRLAHAALVAALAYAWQYELYRTNGLLWALFLAAPAVPLWDLVWPAPKFAWSTTDRQPIGTKGVAHETPVPVPTQPERPSPSPLGIPVGHPLPGPGA